jgi:hypothetical protein
MIFTEVTANPWVYVRGVCGAKLPTFSIFFNEWGTGWGARFSGQDAATPTSVLLLSAGIQCPTLHGRICGLERGCG